MEVQMTELDHQREPLKNNGDVEANMKKYREDYDYLPEFSMQGLYKFWTSICRVEIGPAVEMTAEDKGHSPFLAFIDNTFRITERGSSVYLEVLGGFTAFFSIAWVLTWNPFTIKPVGLATHSSFFSTALTSGVFTSVMGLVTNLPVIVGPSLGLNVYFREIADKCPENKDGTIDGIPCKEWGVTTLPWTDALGAVYISGWLYLALTFTGFRGYLLDAFPKFFRSAIAAGVGFFLIYEGLKIGQITRVTIEKDYLAEAIDYGRCSSSGVCTSPVDLHNRWYNIGVAHLDQVPAARIAIFGFILASGFELFNIKGSFIYAIWIATFVGISYYHCRSTSNYDDDYINECVTDLSIWGGRPEKIPFLVDWSKNPAGELTFKYAKKPLFWKVVWTFLFFQIFDSYGAMEAIISRMKITEKYPTVTADRINRAMAVDGLSVWIGAIMGCNNCNIYAESLTAIEVGSRTGLSAIITGSCLLLCLLFVYPFVYVIPKPAVSSVLILVGIYTMAGEIWKIDTKDFIHRATSLITIATMGFTYSITNGISAGMIFYCWLEITALVMKKVGIDVEVIRPGTKPEVPHPFMILMAVFAAVRFATLGQS